MSSPKKVWILALWLVIQATSSISTGSISHTTEGDFAFDVNEEFQTDISYKTDDQCPVKKLWGVPDMPAYIGRVFKLQIPNEAFSGKISGYKASGIESPLPTWLTLDRSKGLLKGVPEEKDFGEHRLIVTALPFSNYSTKCPIATDTFTIEVKDKNESPNFGPKVMEQCHVGEDESRLIIVIERPLPQISTKQKLYAISKLASFMGLDQNAFLIQPHHQKHEKPEQEIVLMSGLGDKKKKNYKACTEIVLTVGCSGKLWDKHNILVHQMKEQARDGSISYVTRLPVTSWKVVRQKQSHLIRKQKSNIMGRDEEFVNPSPLSSWEIIKRKQANLVRKQRAAPPAYEYEGSADDVGDDGEYSGDDEYYEYKEDGDEVEPANPIVPPPTSPPSTPPPEPPHHHRHHHGETFFTTTQENDITPKKYITDTTSTQSTTETLVSVSTLPITETTNVISKTLPYSPPPTSVVSIPDFTLPAEITTLDDTSQMETETSTIPLSSRNNSEMTRPTTAAMSPTSEVSTFDSPTTPIATPVTQPVSEDTASTLFATTFNANTVQETDDPERPLKTSSSNNVTETSNFDNEIIKQSNFDVSQIPEQNETKVFNSEDSEQITSMMTEPSLRTSSIDFDMDTVIVNNASETSDIPFEVSPPSINTTSIESVTTERSSSIMGITTEIVMFTQPMNWPPQIQHRTKKVAVTAGKAFSYIIPEDLFHDREDGTNLKLAMYDTEHSPLKASSWVQFNPQAREVYGLPLEEHVSKWEYIVEATDSSGASANDTLDITVQQHKGRRTVNHEFSMKLKIQKKYPSVADWQIRILKGLVNLFRDTDMDQITVRDVDLNSDPVEFIWTNDTLPRNYCPKNDIDRLMGILQANSDGDPSPSLISAMSPELRIINVAWRGTNGCQAPPSTPAAPPAPPNHSDNYSPMPRNQIDQLEATVGKLLIFKVPDDTFYDPEDGSARNLKMWLTKGDRSPIAGHNWLQFDSKNQEFYGIPLERDKGRRDYQLVCEDSGGLTANDGLVVEVRPGPSFNPSYEFRMTIDIQHDSFMQSASSKRKFVEKLYHLFNDKNASSIKIKSITDSPTIISWYNVSLPTDKCPHEEIKQLKKILIKENDLSLNERVDEIMGPEFTVDSVSFDFKGICAVGTPVVAVPEVTPNLAGSNEDASKTVGSDDYIITFIIPIVVIICMIIIAALIACILYRRRRSGKMSVGDDEERQAFRSKGIPVIFQDELDEKPDPSNKTPVIMKEEKPPLLPPPEYKEVNSSSPTPSHTPYHPPPPFTTSRDTRNSRPKPTPTYRKPPPYVPP